MRKRMFFFMISCFLFLTITSCRNKQQTDPVTPEVPEPQEPQEPENNTGNTNTPSSGDTGNIEGPNTPSSGDTGNTEGSNTPGGGGNTGEPNTPEVKPIDPNDQVEVLEVEGYLESAYIEWKRVDGADSYNVYYKSKNSSTYKRIDDMLIRGYKEYMRADVLGLKEGEYTLKVIPVDEGKEADIYAERNVTVVSHNRSGFAFSSKSPVKTASGAYNDDGTLKENAQVIYITSKTAKTCQARVNGQTVVGFQAILNAKQKKGTSGDILCFRIIGKVSLADLDSISSSEEGLQVKGAAAYSEMNITIEGIGEDATIHGFGFLIRNCANVEFRNFAIMAFMDDGVSIDTNNCNIWVHNLDIFYGSTGGDADQAKGDGSVDIKGKSTYITVSYVHFWDSGKCSLCRMGDSEEFLVTYHHNWFDHSDSRHPRIRKASVHIYNNYFDGNSKYGVGVTNGSSAFVEANCFRKCKNPMMSSLQGTDLLGKGTFSGESGGMIKAYNNKIIGAHSLIYANSDLGTTSGNATSFDAYLATYRDEIIADSFRTVGGGTIYNNFDTSADYDLGVNPEDIDDPENVVEIVKKYAGRMNGGDVSWNFDDAEDENYSVISGLKEYIVNYKSLVLTIGTGNVEESGSTGGNTEEEPEKPTNPSISGSVVHNFTTDDKNSTLFSITGNTSTSKGTVTYKDLVLTKCLKMESSTSIKFKIEEEMTIYLVLIEKSGNIKIDDKKYTAVDGIITLDLTVGEHEITKADTANLYYIELVSKVN